MMNAHEADYILTIIQHTYCNDCMWMKGKITDAYHASGIVRGEDSKRWRMQIISPPWERDARRAEFPKGFGDVDVPAMKLEVGKRIVFATQNPPLINELLIKLKWMLINRHTNPQIEKQLLEIAKGWKDDPSAGATSCPVDVTASARP